MEQDLSHLQATEVLPLHRYRHQGQPTREAEWLTREQYVELMRQGRWEVRVASTPDSSQVRLLASLPTQHPKTIKRGGIMYN